MNTGILLQGPVTDWTSDIIKTYSTNFPNSEILLSTWDDENTKDISCNIVKTSIPKETHPFKLNANLQKKGTLIGLENMNCDIILKCRTDQYIQNQKIFELYNSFCTPEKIMIPNYFTFKDHDYYASDICQLATKNLLFEYWNSIPLYDGSVPINHVEVYLTANYILRAKHDLSSWENCIEKYFCVKNFLKDFMIRWEKLEKFKEYQIGFNDWYPLCVDTQPKYN